MLDGIRNKAQSFGVKLIFGIIIIVFIFWGVGNLGGMSSDSLAVVNGEKISIREFAKTWDRIAREERKTNPGLFTDDEALKQYKRMVLDELVVTRLLQQEAERLGIVVTAHELRAMIDTYNEFQAENGAFDPVRYKQILAALGQSPGEFENDIRQQMLRAKLIRYLGMGAGLSEEEAKSLYAFRLEKRPVEYVLFAFDDYAAKAEISDEEAAAYYEENREKFRLPVRVSAQYLPLTPETLAEGYPATEEEIGRYYAEHKADYHRPASFQARHILIFAPADNAGQNGSEGGEKLAAVLAGLEKGEDFADLARKYSDDPSSADLGGMLSWINAGESGSPELEELALSLAPGEISKPLRLEEGWHILKLEAKKETRELELAEVRDEIAHALARGKAEADFAAVQQAAEDGLNTGTPLAALAGKFHAKPREAVLVPQEDLERLLGVQSDSRQILADAVAAAEAGSPSLIPVPLSIEGGIALVRLTEGRPSQIPPLGEVAQSVREILGREKARKLARAAAEEALPDFAGRDVPEAFKDKARKSASPAVRISPSVEPLGPAPELVDDLFAAPVGEWLAAAHDTPAGFVIARTLAVEPVADKDWQTYGPSFINRYRRYLGGMGTQTFLQSLYKDARVEVSHDLLDRLNAR